MHGGICLMAHNELIMASSSNKGETYAYIYNQILSSWLDGIRKGFYLSQDLAQLAPVYNGTPAITTYKERLEWISEHNKNIAGKQKALVQDYSRGIGVLQAVIEYGSLPVKERPQEVTLGARFKADGTIEEQTLSITDMFASLQDILKKPIDQITALDVALKNAYSMYLGLRPYSDDNLVTELYILEQIHENASKLPSILKNIIAFTPELVRRFAQERAEKGDLTYKEIEDPNELFNKAQKELGGVLLPWVSEEGHFEMIGKARRANLKGMGVVGDPYLGELETPEFSFMNILLFSAPGAGKNSIAEEIAEIVGCNFETLSMPMTSDADLSMPAINVKTGKVSSKITGNAYQWGKKIGVVLFDEALRVNIEGKTGLERAQDLLLHKRISAQQSRFKGNPASLYLFATNTDRDSKPGETELIGQAVNDRIYPLEITDQMIESGRPVYFKNKFATKLKVGTPGSLLCQFLSSNDPNLGAGNLLNRIEFFDSNYEDLKKRNPSGRPMTLFLNEILYMGDTQVSVDTIVNRLHGLAGEAFASRFKMYARINSALPTMETMLEKAGNIPGVFASAAFDVHFSPFDEKEGKFKISSLNPRISYVFNGGEGLTKDIVESMKEKTTIHAGDKNIPLVPYSKVLQTLVNTYQKHVDTAKTSEEKDKYNALLEKGQKALSLFDGLTYTKLKKKYEDIVSDLFCIQQVEDEDMPEGIKGIKSGLNSPMVQKIFTDRILLSIERHAEVSFRQHEPMDGEFLKKIFTLVAFCPFENFRDNMLFYIKNLFVTNPPSHIEEGLRSYGVAFPLENGEQRVVTANNILEGSDFQGLEDRGLYALFYALPVLSEARKKCSENFARFAMGNNSIVLDSACEMSL